MRNRRQDAMHFLDSPDNGDLEALMALGEILREDEEAFREIVRHPITDDMTPVVAVLPGIRREGLELVQELLNPENIALETRKVSISGTGTVTLAIVRMGGQYANPASMDHLERTVLETAAFMGEPFPRSLVALIFADPTKLRVSGVNFQSGITVRRGLEYDETLLTRTMAHEVAHYYWYGNANWVDEGLANHIANFLEHRRTRLPLAVIDFPCAEHRSIGDFPTREEARQRGDEPNLPSGASHNLRTSPRQRGYT